MRSISGRLAEIYGLRGIPSFVWLLTLGALLKFLAMFVEPFAALYLLQVHDASVEAVGVAVGLRGLGILLGFPVAGFVVDRFGSRRVIIGAALLEGLAMALLSTAPNVTAFAILYFVSGLFAAGFRPAFQSLLGEVCDAALRPRAISLFQSAWNLGSAGALLLGGIIFALAPSLLFPIDAVLNFVAAGLFAGLLFRGGLAGSGSPAAAAPPRLEPLKGPRGLHAAFGVLCLSAFLLECVRAQSVSTLPVFLTEVYGLNSAQFGLILSIGCLLFAAFSLPAISLTARFEKRALVGAAAILMCGAYAFIPFGNGFAAALAVVAFSVFGQMLTHPTLAALATALPPQQARGRFLGAYYGVAASAWVIAPPLGLAAYSAGRTDLLWFGSGLLGVLVAVLMIGWRAAAPEEPGRE